MKTYPRVLSLRILLPAAIAGAVASGCSSTPESFLTSPQGDLTAAFIADSLLLRVTDKGKHAITVNTGGVALSDRGGALKVDSISQPTAISDKYTMLTGKRAVCENQASERVVYLSDSTGKRQNIRVRLYDDGVAFRYELPDADSATLKGEETVYSIQEGTPRWIAKWSDSYEEYYHASKSGDVKDYKDRPLHQWAYPALVNPSEGVWALVTESNIERRQSGSHLENDSVAPQNYRVVIDLNEATIDGEWHTPWRTAIIGDLSDVVESTLVTDLAEPSKVEDTSWIHPGTVSWIYWAYNHGSKDYELIRQYVDMAAKLHLPYVLIDWEWDVMGNGGKIDDAIAYAKEKGVKPILWYNSSTGWITEENGPHFKLNTPENREKEYKWLEESGVAGVKIDFFEGDKQRAMDYSIDLLEDAAKHHLLVNLHGAALPRGWQRTYPNQMTTEGVLGAEWYNNNPRHTDAAPAHNATLPFIRNVVGSMDYTPITFSDSQHPHRTSNAHELALGVVFESGLQMLADKPESYYAQPQAVQDFLGTLPAAWDDTRLLGGYPGEYVVLARQKGNTWYVGVLNGTEEAKTVDLDWSRLNLPKEISVETFADSGNAQNPWQITENGTELPAKVECQPRGGAVYVIKTSK